MAKLSASALRSAAASAREKSAENAINPSLRDVISKKEETAGESKKSKNEQVSENKSEPASSVSLPQNAASQEQEAQKKAEASKSTTNNVKSVLKSYETERKTEHVNLLITQSLSKKIEVIQQQGEFRSKNAAVIAVLEAFCDANGIE